MTDTRTFYIVRPDVRQRALDHVRSVPDGYVVTVKPATRTLAQNARLWAMLSDVSEQVEWYGRRLSPEQWKHIFSASLKKQEVVPGLDGGFVVLGQSTSQMSVREMSDLMELIASFGVERGVVFNDEVAA